MLSIILRLYSLGLISALLVTATAQEEAPAEAAAPVQPAVPVEVEAEKEAEPTSLEALESVQESLALIQEEIAEAKQQLKAASEAEKATILEEIQQLIEREKALNADFEAIATGVDPDSYSPAEQEDFILSNEVDTLLEPIVGELKALTEKPRELEALRSELGKWKGKLEAAETAINNLTKLPENDASKAVSASIEKTKQLWETRRTEAKNRIQAIAYQLEQAEESQPTLIETVKDGFRSFYKSRGRNFLLCIGVFFLTFFLLRFLHQRFDHYFPWHKKETRPFYLRLIDVGLNVFAVLGALVASLITLYATGDWVLMGLAIILLLGLSIAAKNAIPKFYDHARLLLNLGEIREGERVTFNGIPWRVERLNFYTTLVNPELRCGLQRLPINQISGLISRPICNDGELWFPCKEGDWMELSDGFYGRVLAQTPEYVQLVELGGAKTMIPTTDFLSMAPKNLSNGFRINTTFGIDYDHQAESTESIPEIMWTYITRELTCHLKERDLLVNLRVEFASAGASSLDLAIIGDFNGALAPRYTYLPRLLQRYAVDCCNENGWIIPFTQITLHNAYENSPAEPCDIVEEKPKLP